MVQPYICNPHTLNSEGFINFLTSHTETGGSARAAEFREERQHLQWAIPAMLEISSEAVRKYMPEKTSTGLTECRDALAELRAYRLSLPTVSGIAYAASHDCHECNSSCDEIICKVNPIITIIDSLGLAVAEFVDTHFYHKYCPSDYDDLRSLMHITIPDAEHVEDWIRLTDSYRDSRTREACQAFYKNHVARLASMLLCPSQPDMRYPQQHGENIWAALTAATKSAPHVPPHRTLAERFMVELQSLCGDATVSLEGSEILDEETLKTKWSTILSKAEEYVELRWHGLGLRDRPLPIPLTQETRGNYLRGRLDTETPLPGSWLARLASSNNLSVSVQEGPVYDPSDFDGQDGNINVEDQSDQSIRLRQLRQ